MSFIEDIFAEQANKTREEWAAKLREALDLDSTELLYELLEEIENYCF